MITRREAIVGSISGAVSFLLPPKTESFTSEQMAQKIVDYNDMVYCVMQWQYYDVKHGRRMVTLPSEHKLSWIESKKRYKGCILTSIEKITPPYDHDYPDSRCPPYSRVIEVDLSTAYMVEFINLDDAEITVAMFLRRGELWHRVDAGESGK